MILDFRRRQVTQSPLHTSATTADIVHSFKFLGVHITDNLSWSLNTSSLVIKAQQCLYLLRKSNMHTSILNSFYRSLIEHPSLQNHSLMETRKESTAAGGAAHYWVRFSFHWGHLHMMKSHSIMNDPSHPSYGLFTPPIWMQATKHVGQVLQTSEHLLPAGSQTAKQICLTLSYWTSLSTLFSSLVLPTAPWHFTLCSLCTHGHFNLYTFYALLTV